MVFLSLLLLPEWQRYRENWNRSRIKCMIFGSFLNLESLQLAYKLSQGCNYNNQTLPERICWEAEQILLIFFPISRKLQENFELKYRMEDLVMEQVSEMELQHAIQTILTRSHEIV
jgi:hypothetical protein